MGKTKTRAYKHRLDKYYYLAKQTRYRSRAAFKLIQLNNQYDFLSNANICLDLCAAPGGWSQVASQYMPIGSTIIAIDLAPIKDIPRVITLQGDILLPKTHSRVKKIIQNNKADVVLNDGAPNVGAAWNIDSSNQLDLCLASVKFATLFLRKGGSFVTKVFRSEFYQSLLWVLEKLFDSVHSTKPKASRDSSAELFVVALGYKAPDYVDPRLLDPSYVFTDLSELMKGNSATEDIVVKKTSYDFSTCSAVNFLRHSKPYEILNTCNQIVFDEDVVSQAALINPNTNDEIKILCKDLKRLGLGDKRVLFRWHKKLRDALITTEAPPEVDTEKREDEFEEEEDSDLLEAIKEMKLKKRREERAARRKKAKYLDRLIKRLKEYESSHSVDIADPALRRPRPLEYPSLPDEDANLTYEEKIEKNLEKIYEIQKNEGKTGLVDDGQEVIGPRPRFVKPVELDVDQIETDEVKSNNIRMWYNQEIFGSESEYEDYTDDSDKEEEKETDDNHTDKEEEDIENQEDGEVADDNKEPDYKLIGQQKKDFNAASFKLAKQINTTKGRNQLIDDSFNRFMYPENPDNLPAWFIEDEKAHNFRQVPTTREEFLEFKKHMKEINEVDSKRVIEARTRKRAKVIQRTKAAQEKIDEIAEKEGINEREKLRMMENYRNRLLRQMNPAPTIVRVQKRDNGKPIIPKHNKNSRVMLVDPRMKKDLRAKKNAEKRPNGVVRKKKSKYIHRKK